MKGYFDDTFLTSPLSEYFSWLTRKYALQLKCWGKHLRIGYMSKFDNVTFGRFNQLGEECVVSNCTMGDFSYINSHSCVHNTTIGRFTSIGPGVMISPGKYPAAARLNAAPARFYQRSAKRYQLSAEKKIQNQDKVTIGNDVWIGANSVIVDGVSIADGAIVAANSLITADVGPYEIVGGNPSRLIRKRFDEDQINYLLDFKWWNESEEWIERNISKFWDVKTFVEQTARS